VLAAIENVPHAVLVEIGVDQVAVLEQVLAE
jgi:hypothetical protein